MNSYRFWRGLLAFLVVALPASVWASKPLIQAFPRPKDASAAARVEPIFREIDRTKARNAFDCWKEAKGAIDRASFRRGVGFAYDVRYRVLLEDRRFLSVRERTEAYCANPYPSTTTVALTYDLVTGEKYDPLRLYRIGRASASGARAVPEVEVMIVKRTLAWLDREGLRAECAEAVTNEVSTLENGSLGFTPRGLIFLPQVGHAVQGCFGEVILPYQELVEYLDRQEAARVGWMR